MRILNQSIKLTASVLMIAPILAVGQPTQTSREGGFITSIGLTGINQFQTNLNSGGNFGMTSGSAYFNALTPISQQTTVGLTLRYDQQTWTWKNVQGDQSPWKYVQSPALAFNYFYRVTPEWQLGLVPTIESSGEPGTKFADSLTYGAVMSASKRISPTLRLGFGAGVFRQIDTTKYFPYLVIDWKINDRWSLNNPLPAGPAGGAGLELTYAVTPQFKVSAGGAYRSYRFRLNESGPYAGGVGQNTVFPLFAKFSYAFDRTAVLDLYGLVGVAGNVSATNTNLGNEYKSNYNTSPAIALSFTKRF